MGVIHTELHYTVCSRLYRQCSRFIEGRHTSRIIFEIKIYLKLLE